MLVEIPPKDALAAVVQEMKVQTSKDLRKQFKFINKIYSHSGIWGTGYFVSTVGLNEAQIRRYIDRQDIHDRGVDVSAEFE